VGVAVMATDRMSEIKQTCYFDQSRYGDTKRRKILHYEGLLAR